MYTRIDSMMYR